MGYTMNCLYCTLASGMVLLVIGSKGAVPRDRLSKTRLGFTKQKISFISLKILRSSLYVMCSILDG